ncbi:histidine kinase [Paenibacillus hodogayensis]|uniref:histidine kinase n=1 Tax=Paenibacillus hodogayensis TaxID=279208 RepID=A0ABV5VR36_9BACL
MIGEKRNRYRMADAPGFRTTGAGGDTKKQIHTSSARNEAHILIVDSLDDRSVPESLLALENVRISTASRGEEALRLLARIGKPDLVVLELALPDLSGAELCRRIRERCALYELPVLVLAEGGCDEDMAEALSAGANDFLARPVQASELRVRAATLLAMGAAVRERVKIESSLLRSQIKPQFLFNALNSIMALSEESPEQMRLLLMEFSRYMRESFRYEGLSQVVAFERELQLIRSYLYIERTRFGERLRATIKVQEGLAFYLPPLTIQPIVENAIRHGLMKRKTGGRLSIAVSLEEGFYVIRIRDDGVGIENTMLKELQADCGPMSGKGISIANARLMRQYGTRLDIESEPGRGTNVTVKLPAAIADSPELAETETGDTKGYSSRMYVEQGFSWPL